MADTYKKRRKPRGCLKTFLVLLIIALLAFFGYHWLHDASALVPDRESGSQASADKLYILLAGSDMTELMETARTDTIILACVDTKEGSVFLLSIPRDSYVSIPGYGYDKINHSFAYGGIDLLRQTVSELTGLPVDYYALVDFSGFEEIVDALGGVEIDVDKRMYYQTYDALIDIEAGLQRLDGEKALQYVRYRSDAMGDISRVSRQQTLLKAIYTEFTENGGWLKLPRLVPAVYKAVETDLSSTQLLRLTVFIKGLNGDSISSETLPGDFMTMNGTSYWQVNEAELAELTDTVFGDGDGQQ